MPAIADHQGYPPSPIGRATAASAVLPLDRPVLLGRDGRWRGVGQDAAISGDAPAALQEAVDGCLALGSADTVVLPSDDGAVLVASIAPLTADEALVWLRDDSESRKLRRQADDAARELAVLLDVSANLAAQHELRPLLEMIIEQVHGVVDYGRASVYLLESETLYLLASRSSRSGIADPPGSYHMTASDLGPLWERVSAGRYVLIADLHTDVEFVGPLRTALGSVFASATANVHAQLVVPLALKDRVIGMITLTHEEMSFYNAHQADLMMAIGAQAAIAIENARLFERTQRLAAVEERQRLARELHDSVSQALYGIALGARTARTLLDRDPARAIGPVEYVLQLAEAGQAEMRALIFELRPESLEREGLVSALQKQVDAVSSRYALDIAADLGPEPSLTLSEKEVFYRIGQEALHNVVKHARARHVRVSLAGGARGMALEVEDDGIGFAAGESFPGHMGLVSMAERAASVGAMLEVESAPGNGTRLRLSLQGPSS